jgi:branched-chain amino acid aminotransferase
MAPGLNYGMYFDIAIYSSVRAATLAIRHLQFDFVPVSSYDEPPSNTITGLQCYEGLKAFRTPDGQINMFRPNMNAQRMQHSAAFVSIPAVPVEHFIDCCRLAVGLNAEFVPPYETGAAMYIRPLLFGSSAQLGLNPPEEYTFLVYVLPVGVYHGVHPVDALILEHFDRAAPEGTGSAKVGGNYAPVLRWSEKAYKEGYGITLHLDSKTRTVIDEFSTSAFIGVKKDGDKVSLVVPDSKSAIKSVTSDSVQEIARSFGWSVTTRPVGFLQCFQEHIKGGNCFYLRSFQVTYEELADFDEVIAAGTAAALVPIKSITKELTGKKTKYIEDDSNEPGEVCVKLLTTLKGIQRGEIKDQFGWLDQISAPKGYAANANGVNGADDSVDSLP